MNLVGFLKVFKDICEKMLGIITLLLPDFRFILFS